MLLPRNKGKIEIVHFREHLIVREDAGKRLATCVQTCGPTSD